MDMKRREKASETKTEKLANISYLKNLAVLCI